MLILVSIVPKKPAFAPYDPADRVGRWLAGKWLLEELIGEGGAATVYLAVDRAGTLAAVKVLHSVLAVDEPSRRRFVREAYLANRIDHPGVARVLEDGEAEDGAPYLVMELLEGETVEARRQRRRGPLPIDETIWIVDQLLGILAAAHAKGVVHRDIKPENLFLTIDQKLKLLDFGVARFSAAARATTRAQAGRPRLPTDPDVSDGFPRVTNVGAVLGTVGYMPPEQARGETSQIGIESDLFAVGATMYTLLSGRLVRDFDTLQAALTAATTLPVPSLAETAPEMPAEIVDFVDYALSLDIKVRWPSAIMMRRALQRAYVRTRRQSERLWAGDDIEREESEPALDLSASGALEPPVVSVVQRVRKNAEESPPTSRRGLRALPTPAPITRPSTPPKNRWRALPMLIALLLLTASLAVGLTLLVLD